MPRKSKKKTNNTAATKAAAAQAAAPAAAPAAADARSSTDKVERAFVGTSSTKTYSGVMQP